MKYYRTIDYGGDELGSMKSMNKKNNFSFDPVRLKTNHLSLNYKSAILNKHIIDKIEGISPNMIPNDISTLILPKIWKNMHISIQKDIKELFEVFYIQQWTSTSLIAMRLLERTLCTHLECDLKEDGVNGLGDAIQKLNKHNYETVKLNEYREKRNSLMHGHIRASSKDTKELVNYVMQIVLHVFNIEGE